MPYFKAGMGHVSFARAIRAEILARRPEWEVRLMDVGAELPGELLSDLYVRSWQKILAQPNWVKNGAFALNAMFPWIFGLLNKRAIREALPAALLLLEEYRPDLILPTHWGCGHLFEHARRLGKSRVPLFYLYTELAGAAKQIRCGADIYFCLSEDALAALMKIGIPRSQLVVTDLIVQNELLGELPDRAESRRELGLTEDRFTVVFSLGGEGIGKTFPFLDHFYTHGRHAQMLVLTGNNTDLLQSLLRRYPERTSHAKIVPVGFRSDLRRVFSAADLLTGKCGTGFAVEAIKTHRPLIINSLGAPNEADNRDYLVKRGFGSYTPRPADLTALIETYAIDDKLYLASLEPFTGVTDRNGAADIADYVVPRVT